MPSISAVLTAAGESVRMGRAKPLLTWHGVTLVEYQIASLVDAGVSEVVVVLGHRHETVATHVRGLGVRHVVNPHYRQGRATSIKAGLATLNPSMAEAVLVLNVDQPRTETSLQHTLEAHRQHSPLITIPTYKNRGVLK